jgi:transposase-like protein
MVIVGVREFEVESALREGVGPELPAAARCPACGGRLGRWGSYRRWARRREEMHPLRIARAICHSCRRTHALLPSFLYARRTDLAELILGALEMAAAGRGHRPAATRAGVPEATARGWLRRSRRVAGERRAAFCALAAQLGALPPRSPPAEEPLAALLEAIGLAHRAAKERFGAAAPARAAAFSVAASGGLLLANTDCPFPGAPDAVRVAPANASEKGRGIERPANRRGAVPLRVGARSG